MLRDQDEIQIFLTVKFVLRDQAILVKGRQSCKDSNVKIFPSTVGLLHFPEHVKLERYCGIQEECLGLFQNLES